MVTKPLSRTKISDVPIRFVSQLLDAPEGNQEIRVLPKPSYTSNKSWFGLESYGELFAVLSKKISLGFHDLLDKADVEYRAVIDLKEAKRRTKSLKRSEVASMTIDVNIYGHIDNAELTGRVLSSLGLYIQQPVLQRSGTTYYNPHFFHMDEIGETPKFGLDYDISGNQQRLGGASYDGNSNADHSSDIGQDSSEDVSSILGSLTQNTNIGKRVGDTGLITILKEFVASDEYFRHWIMLTDLSHQMQALDFVFLRETLTNLPKELNLWVRHDLGEQECM